MKLIWSGKHWIPRGSIKMNFQSFAGLRFLSMLFSTIFNGGSLKEIYHSPIEVRLSPAMQKWYWILQTEHFPDILTPSRLFFPLFLLIFFFWWWEYLWIVLFFIFVFFSSLLILIFYSYNNLVNTRDGQVQNWLFF